MAAEKCAEKIAGQVSSSESADTTPSDDQERKRPFSRGPSAARDDADLFVEDKRLKILETDSCSRAATAAFLKHLEKLNRQDPQHLFNVNYAIIHMSSYAKGRPSEIGAVTFSLEEGLASDFFHRILNVGSNSDHGSVALDFTPQQAEEFKRDRIRHWKRIKGGHINPFSELHQRYMTEDFGEVYRELARFLWNPKLAKGQNGEAVVFSRRHNHFHVQMSLDFLAKKADLQKSPFVVLFLEDLHLELLQRSFLKEIWRTPSFQTEYYQADRDLEYTTTFMEKDARAACQFHQNIAFLPPGSTTPPFGPQEEIKDMRNCPLGYARVLVYNLCMLYTGNDPDGTRQPTPFKVVQGRHIPWTYEPAGDCRRQYKLRDTLGFEGHDVLTAAYDFFKF